MGKMNKEYSVTQCLPNHDSLCYAFGYKTFCCKEDMDDQPDWYLCKFRFVTSEYKLKNQIPENLEESILEYYKIIEKWDVISDDDPKEHLIGVTKWKEQEHDHSCHI